MHEHAPLIDSLGGGTSIAQWLTERTGQSVDREAVYKWKRIGVPWRYRFLISQLASDKAVTLPAGFLADTAA